jgi:polar amino acid transport system ATP-binding protein
MPIMPDTVQNPRPILTARNICKHLGGKPILQSVDLTLEKGALKVLIGPSGGGKSTLLQCLNFLIPPDQGDIELEGKPVIVSHRRDLYAYRQQVGMIFQDFNLFDHLTALDNVSIALRKVKKLSKSDARERAEAQLRQVGLANRMHLHPAELSGGQKQRVSIARALAMDPKIMLLDEPTSALDPELIGEVLAVIQDLAKGGMTMLMATHQIGFIRSLANEILFMEKGRIIENGPPQTLLSEGSGTRSQAFISKLNALYADVPE